MGSPRITGRAVHFVIDGVDRFADASSVIIDHDTTALRDLHGHESGAETDNWFMDVTAIQSTDPDSLWSLLFDNEYKQVTILYAPNGNPVPSEDKPWFAAPARLGPAPKLGGEADKQAEYTFETKIHLGAKPVRVFELGDLLDWGYEPDEIQVG